MQWFSHKNGLILLAFADVLWLQSLLIKAGFEEQTNIAKTCGHILVLWIVHNLLFPWKCTGF